MSKVQASAIRGLFVLVLCAGFVGLLANTASAVAADGSDLKDQLAEIKAKLEKLEAALGNMQHAQHQQPATGGNPAQGMSGMGANGMQGMGSQGGNTMSSGMGNQGGNNMSGGMGMMGMMNEMGGTQGMGGNQGGANMQGGMGMMGMMRSMKMMGDASGAGTSTFLSALPGFPGTSHIYHIGATGFFVDHADHIKLTNEQKTSLNKARDESALEQATYQRKIEQAEQELFSLTSADAPDAQKIEAKVREVEKLRGDQRLAFIRSVGEAAKVLTEEQRKILTGETPQPNAPQPGGNAMQHM